LIPPKHKSYKTKKNKQQNKELTTTNYKKREPQQGPTFALRRGANPKRLGG